MIIDQILPFVVVFFLVSLAGALVFVGLYVKSCRTRGAPVGGHCQRHSNRKAGSILASLAGPETPGQDASSEYEDALPNGWRRGDYYQYGLGDAEIEYWGLDQPGAPEPFAASLAIADIVQEGQANAGL